MCHQQARFFCKILKHQQIAKDIYEMVIETPEMAKAAKPGQFINLYAQADGKMLPRPISICEINASEGWLKVVYAVVGAGTREISAYQEGGTIEVMGPLGIGFNLVEGEHSILVGGGVGTPPMLELAKSLSGKKTIYLGFRTAPYLVEELEKQGTVYVATDDGSVGHHGTVLDLMKAHEVTGHQMYACGPKPMLKAVQQYGFDKQIDTQLSLEERMGCGFGGCVGCVCKVHSDNAYGYTYKKVCKDGPVFKSQEVIFE